MNTNLRSSFQINQKNQKNQQNSMDQFGNILANAAQGYVTGNS